MDVYTTAFTYPRRARTIPSATSNSSSTAFPVHSLHDNQNQNTSDADAVQKLAVMAMTLHGVHVTFFFAAADNGWNFHITGPYQQVMLSRGMILKDCPVQVRWIPLYDS